MDCCTVGIDKFFSKWAARYSRRFRRKGLEKIQKHLVEGITVTEVTSKSILDIGCGVGALHLTLLQRGAASATGIDVAEGMIVKAKELAAELRLSERTTYHVGDFVSMDGTIEPTDITVLDKVVCCYADIDSLLDHSLEKTREIYALSFPRDWFPVRWGFRFQILLGLLLKWSFRPYWHDWEAVCGRIEAASFRETYRSTTLIWTGVVFRRR